MSSEYEIIDIKLGTDCNRKYYEKGGREGQRRPEITTADNKIHTFENKEVSGQLGIWKKFNRDSARELLGEDKHDELLREHPGAQWIALGGWDGTGTESPHLYRFRWKDGKFYASPLNSYDKIAKYLYEFYIKINNI